MSQQKSLYFRSAGPTPAVAKADGDAGLRAYLTGQSAERAVAHEYLSRGCDRLEQRWRGGAGEIDLILRDGQAYVFCEVKQARDFERAIARLRPEQMQRIHAAASEYLGTVPEGQLAEVRFDLALVNQRGEIRILENAFGHF